MHYCQLKISKEAIQLLEKTKGQIPNTFFEAFKIIEWKDAYLIEKDKINRERDAKILNYLAQLSEKVVELQKKSDIINNLDA